MTWMEANQPTTNNNPAVYKRRLYGHISPAQPHFLLSHWHSLKLISCLSALGSIATSLFLPGCLTWHGGRQDGLSHQPRLQQTLVKLSGQYWVGGEVNAGVRVRRRQETNGLKAFRRRRLLLLVGRHRLHGVCVCALTSLTGRRGGTLGFASLAVRPEVELNVCFAVAGGSEAKVAEGAFERLGASVQAHVHLQAAFSGERGVAHVTAEQLLTCKDQKRLLALWVEIPNIGCQRVTWTMEELQLDEHHEERPNSHWLFMLEF